MKEGRQVMLNCARQAIEAIERLERSDAQFTKAVQEIVKPACPAGRPVNLADCPNPYDEELFLSGDDDGSGLEPHRR